MKNCRIKITGLGIIEVMLAVAVLLFVLFATLSLLSSNFLKSDLLIKKVRLVDKLDAKVSRYMIDGVFDNSASDNTKFSKTIVGTKDEGRLYEFIAANSDSGLSVKQRLFISIKS